jgi:hypothetical protein
MEIKHSQTPGNISHFLILLANNHFVSSLNCPLFVFKYFLPYFTFLSHFFWYLPFSTLFQYIYHTFMVFTFPPFFYLSVTPFWKLLSLVLTYFHSCFYLSHWFGPLLRLSPFNQFFTLFGTYFFHLVSIYPSHFFWN